MKIPIFQKGFNYSQDGPGNRLVYHLPGCNLRCPWCSNPEGMEIYSKDQVKRGIQEFSVEEIVREVCSCSMMFFDGGGVTLTGGEPSLFLPAIHTLFTELVSSGISTAIETNGTHPQLDKLFPLVDFLIMDCKHFDPIQHKNVTGMDNSVILNNLEKAAKTRKQLLIRIPLIGGINTRPGDAEGFVRLFSSINTPFLSVELLPYHEYGKSKWEKLGRPYQMKGAFVLQDEVDKFRKLLLDNGIHVINT